MKNSWKDVKGLIDYSDDGILSKVVSKDGGSDITLFCMAKNTEISSHTTTKKAIVYVIEGDGVFNLEGEDILMQPGVLITMDRDAVHSLRAKEDTSFLLILD